MNVSACLVTRGDVDLEPVLASLPFDDIVVWDNSKRGDLAVYGRYAAIAEAKYDLIYVQDDDCVVSDPQAIVDAWTEYPWDDFVVCNMPEHFRHDFYRDHSLVGFGSVFHRDAPWRAFMRVAESGNQDFIRPDTTFFHRTCDVVFTALTPRVLVDVPFEHLPWAHADNRMWKQPAHVGERAAMLEVVLKVRGS